MQKQKIVVSDKPEFREGGAEQDAKGRSGVGSRCSHVAVDKKPPRRHVPEAELQGTRGRAESAFAVGAWGPLTQPLGSRQKQRTESREDTETRVTNPTGTC